MNAGLRHPRVVFDPGSWLRAFFAASGLLLPPGLWFPGCFPMGPPDGDIIPPTVLQFSPTGYDVLVDSCIEVKFSERVDDAVVTQGLIALGLAEQLDQSFYSDFDNPPLSSSRRDSIIPGHLAADPQSTTVTLQPDVLLENGKDYQIVVSAAVKDLAGNPIVDQLHFDERGRAVGTQTHLVSGFTTRAVDPIQPAAGLVFSEILANPAGTESQGEYIEVANLGADAVDLSGFRIDDTGGQSDGDCLSPCGSDPALLAPGKLALLVGKDFVAPPDIAPGTLLLCDERNTLTTRGLKNSKGEVLVLKDNIGNEVTRYGGWVDYSSHEGCGLARIDLSAPDGPGNWEFSKTDPCRTPGWIPGWP